MERVGQSFCNGRSQSKHDLNAETFENALEKMLDGFAKELSTKEEIITRIAASINLPEFHEKSKILRNFFFKLSKKKLLLVSRARNMVQQNNVFHDKLFNMCGTQN